MKKLLFIIVFVFTIAMTGNSIEDKIYRIGKFYQPKGVKLDLGKVLVAICKAETNCKLHKRGKAGEIGPFQIMQKYWHYPEECLDDYECGAYVATQILLKYGFAKNPELAICRYNMGYKAKDKCKYLEKIKRLIKEDKR